MLIPDEAWVASGRRVANASAISIAVSCVCARAPGLVRVRIVTPLAMHTSAACDDQAAQPSRGVCPTTLQNPAQGYYHAT